MLPLQRPAVEPLPDVARIAVLRGGGLGDLLVAEPALDALRGAYPAAHITLLCSDGQTGLWRDRPAPVDETVVVPPVAGVRVADGRPDASVAQTESWCAAQRKRGYDLAVQLHGGGASSNALLRRLGARVTVGSQAPGAPDLDLTVRWTPYQPDVLRWLEVVALVGAVGRRLHPHLHVHDHELAAADRLLHDAGTGDGAPLVALHPGASEPRRRWPADRLAAVGADLTAAGAAVVLLAGPCEEDAADAVRRGLGARFVDLAGAMDLSGLIGVLARSRLFVGNDSGPRHIADALGVATVGVYTKWNLVDVAPLSRQRHRVAVSWQTRCATCGVDVYFSPCGHDATALADVPTEEVTAAARDLLAQVGGPAHSRT